MLTRGTLAVAIACALAPAAYAAQPAAAAAAHTAPTTRTLPGGALLSATPGTVYELGRTIKLQLGPEGSERTTVQVLKLSAGRITLELPELKVPKTAVLIQAPGKVSAVAKGGLSTIAVGDRVAVAAVRGEMLAALGNDWKPLASGKLRAYGGGTYEERAVPAPPSVSADRTLALALEGTASTLVTAKPEPSVHHVIATVYRVEGDRRTLVNSAELGASGATFADLAPGRYEIRGRAVDHFGIESASGEPVTVRVVGAELPEGARVNGGAILLGKSGRVKLIGAEGLEASYGRATLFIPAPKDVGLARGDTTLLRLREPNGAQELGVLLEPRTLRAEVEIGPRAARWPKDALEVSVRVFDHRGRAMTEPLKVPPRVFVNVDAVAPEWVHAGNTWRAKILPKAGPGPWVVRVEVEDDFGEEVGRDFMELAASQTN